MLPWDKIQLLEKALALYAGEHVLDRVLSKGVSALSGGGESAELTLLFVDVAAPVAATRAFSGEELSTFMWKYLEAVTATILGAGGTLDMYVGDSASAWWGSECEPGHAKQACAAPKSLVAAVEELNGEHVPKGFPTLRIKIGVHTGKVTLGNYGTTKRLRYSVLGDAVNLTSRLCGLANGQYESPIVISSATKNLIDSTFAPTLLDSVTVKGQNEPLQLFAI